MEKIHIYVSTVTGNAELVAEDIMDGIMDGAGDKVACDIVMTDDLTADDIVGVKHAVFVSSTYGVGDVPDNGVSLYLDLQTKKPNLDSLTYGAVSLGDSTYSDTFAFGGRKWDDLIAECGGKRLGDLLVLDASSNDDPQDLAMAWANEWRDKLLEVLDGA